ncbi:MAG TPA: MFS transporter [Actinocrinis sp.]|uniref:MFS transporter n=1 Tax=Actinocrinis sp. TaxID=1920516 RepID=UPI002DDCE810|nr:MFS transporter [Actinocrinis sp.]HEV2343339.1 MFS transporter [Actinocrinis sp.]
MSTLVETVGSTAAESAAAENAALDDGLFSRKHSAVTIGIVSSILLTAFEAMAVSTAMPVAVADLRGLPFYSLAFSAFLTLSLLGMVLAGQRADAHGPRLPFLTGTGLFGAGLIAAGTSTSMAQFVIGRAVQGFGAGMVIVSLYVLVGRAYPDRLHAKVFSVMASCWVLPAIIGPFISGVLTEQVSWRWVFLGVAALIPLPLLVLTRPLAALPAFEPKRQTADDATRLRTVRVAAATTALGAGLFQFGGQRIDWVGALLVPLALVLLIPSVPKLLPHGIFRAGRGLPTVVAMRGLMAGAYFGIESFIPLMLVQVRGLSVTTAGLSLTGAALSWAFAAWLINRPWLRARLSQAGMVRFGSGVTTVALFGAIAAISPHVPAWTAAAAMFFAAFGMGFVFPNVSVLTLELSAPGDQGANAASLQVADGLTSTLSVAVAGAVYHALHSSAHADGPVFALMYGMFIAVGAVGWLIAPRVRVR